MRSYWGRANPNSNMAYVLIRRRSYEAKEHHKKCTIWPWMREWVMQLQVRDCLRWPSKSQKLVKCKKCSSAGFVWSLFCRWLDFRVLASRTVRKYIPAVLSHLVYDTLLGQSQESNTLTMYLLNLTTRST